ncbi:MAG: hypothetical protein WBG36_13350 [Ornithinimicrobium sp.]
MAGAPINPVALAWACEVSHLAVEELATALNVSPGRVAEFAGGDALPTFRRAGPFDDLDQRLRSDIAA